jgi:hypothetical protein
MPGLPSSTSYRRLIHVFPDRGGDAMPQSISTATPHRTLQTMVDTLQEMAVGLEAWAAGRTYNRTALLAGAERLVSLSKAGPAERELLELTAGLMLCAGDGFRDLDQRGRRRASSAAARLLNCARRDPR